MGMNTVEPWLSVDLCVVPIGVGVSLSPYIATCQRVIESAGLVHELGPNGTAIEGPWDDVMKCVRACHAAMHDMSGFMGKNNPDVTGIIRQIVSTHQQGLTSLVKSPQEAFRAVVGNQCFHTGLLNQFQIRANLIPA